MCSQASSNHQPERPAEPASGGQRPTSRLDVMTLPPPGEHGGDGRRVAAALGIDPAGVLDLSMSLNPVAPPVSPVIARYLDRLGEYPDPTMATAALAEALEVDPARVLLTNGGAEAIALVAAELGRAWVEEPDFGLYRRHVPVLDPAAGRFRSNPHSPTGRLAGPDEVAAVWDEAFYPLATGRWTRGDADRGSIVVGSLTKLFACPGLRLGYVLAPDDELVERLARRQPRWSVNGLAAAALPDLLAIADLPGWAAAVRVHRAELVRVLRAHGFAPEAAEGCWVLVPAPDLRARLLPSGIVVRDCTSFGLPGVARVAVPDADGLARLDGALSRLS
jgi:histidinol-phosphate/aromatic aminotransferase/cobyric acid decarboxylase-like protein